jgi:hypothetical protein
MTYPCLCRYVPVNGFLAYLAEGWEFPEMVVEPMDGHHGHYSVIMIRGKSR